MKVLCVSPRFAPVNAADSHRVRLVVPHLLAQGCRVEILAVDPSDVVGPQDAELAARLPQSLKVHHVSAWGTSWWGMNGLAQRSFQALYRKGCDLLAHGNFDLVFFSTTEFLLHALGPMWRRKYGVPFCMDLQDPWVNDYYRDNPHVPRPGGRLKYFVADRLHRMVEKAVVCRAHGFLSVSPAYLPMLQRRYGSAVAGQPQLVAGFPGEPEEFNAMATEPRATQPTNPRRWLYVGRGGADMAKAASAFFLAWSKALAQGILPAGSARFEAIGTSYATKQAATKTLEPLAQAFALGAYVHETPERLGYVPALRKLTEADALVVFGSDDPNYTASKIYPYLLAGRPLLAIFHEASSVVPLMRSVGGGTCVVFGDQSTIETTAEAIYRDWFVPKKYEQPVPLDTAAFEPYTARAQAVDIGAWFDRVVAHEA